MSFNFSATAGTSGMSTIHITATTREELTTLTRNYTLSNESGSSILMQVSQEAYEPVEKYLSINPSSIVWDASGGTGSITIQSNDDWTISSNGWISLSRMYDGGKGGLITVDERPNTLSGNGNTIIGIYCGENEGVERTGYISGYCVSDSSITASTTVVQSGATTKPYIALGYYTYSASSTSATTSVTVSSNTIWSVVADARWITLNTLSGNGNGNISFDVDANVDGLPRKGIITATASGGVYAELVIEQAANEKQYIFLYPEKFQVDATGSTGNVITVSANCDYDIDADVDWIVLNAESGTGNGSVSFSTLPTDRVVSNVGNIVFSNSAISSYATVERRQAEKYLYANTPSITVGLDSSTTIVQVYSNVNWEAVVDFGDVEINRTWATVSPSSGSGNGNITISVDASLDDRSCSVVLINNQYGLSYTVNVIQKNPNVIYYTSTDNNIVVPSGQWEANIVSNTYVDGQGMIVFDGTITTTPNGSFSYNSNLLTIEIPSTVETIGYESFRYCTNLTRVVLPDNAELGISSFADCSGLEYVKLPNNLTIIPNNCFGGCRSLTGITIPSSVTTIKELAFGYNGFRTLDLPNLVTSIEYRAFDSSSFLTSIYSRNTTAPSLGESVFRSISNTGTLHYPAGSDYSSWRSQLPNGWTFIDDL